MKKIFALSLLVVGVPFLASAEAGVDAFSILATIAQFIQYAMPVLIALAVIYFIWGVIQYTVSTDEEAKKGARGKIIQGLIGLFVIVAFWGIISLITTTFGVGPEKLNPDAIPCVPNPLADITCD